MMLKPYHEVHRLAQSASRSAERVRTLADSIESHGLIHAMTVAVMADGRRYLAAGVTREQACDLLGAHHRYEEREFSDDLDLVTWILEENNIRRHDSPSQRAWYALGALPVYEDAARARMSAGGQGWANLPDLRSRDEVATLCGVSGRLVQDAKHVAESGVEALKAMVLTGDVAVSAAAKVADLPAAEQVRVVAMGPDGVRTRASQLREQARIERERAANPEPPPRPQPTQQPARREPEPEYRHDTAGHMPDGVVVPLDLTPDDLTTDAPLCDQNGVVVPDELAERWTIAERVADQLAAIAAGFTRSAAELRELWVWLGVQTCDRKGLESVLGRGLALYATDQTASAIQIGQTLADIAGRIRPASVCPRCGGVPAGCAGCQFSGMGRAGQ